MSESGTIAAEGGGYWSIDGIRVDTGNTSATVYSLARRGLLMRTNVDARHYRDTYRLNEPISNRPLTVKEARAMFAAIDEAKANRDWTEGR